MGYTIVYDRRFLRTTKGIVPMVLAGSNNCYSQEWDSCGRTYMKRERYWTFFFSTEALNSKPEKILAEAEKTADGQTPTSSFWYHGNWVMTDQELNWFRRGIQDARTLEEYRMANPGLSLHCYVRVYPDIHKSDGMTETEVYCHTTAEVEQWIEAAKKRSREIRDLYGEDARCYLNLAFSQNEPLKTIPSTSGSVVIKYKQSFVSNYECGRSLSFTADPKKAAVFSSAEDALNAVGRNWNHLRFVKAENVIAEKDFVLLFTGGRLRDQYYSRASKSFLYGVWKPENAQKFRNRSDAARKAKTLRERWPERSTGPILVVNLKTGEQEPVAC